MVFATEESGISDHALKATLLHIGTAIIVAGLVSAFFDIWYHKAMFADPVDNIQEKVSTLQSGVRELDKQVVEFGKSLGATRDSFSDLQVNVQTFAQVFRATNDNGITSIMMRHHGNDRAHWKEEVRKRVSAADDFVVLMARTFSELLPLTHGHNGLKEAIIEKGRKAQIVVLLPDTYSKDGQFRIETEAIASGPAASAHYARTRDTVREILDIARIIRSSGAEENSLSIRLCKRSPPFAMIMTEKCAIIEPYLPYKSSGNSLVFEVKASSNIYRSHKESFQRMYSESQNVIDVLNAYLERKPDKMSDYSELLAIATYVKVASDQVFNETSKLKLR